MFINHIVKILIVFILQNGVFLKVLIISICGKLKIQQIITLKWKGTSIA